MQIGKTTGDLYSLYSRQSTSSMTGQRALVVSPQHQQGRLGKQWTSLGSSSSCRSASALYPAQRESPITKNTFFLFALLALI